MKKFLMIILFFTISSYGHSWLHHINTYAGIYSGNGETPVNSANASFTIKEKDRSSFDFTIKNDKFLDPSGDQAYIGGKDDCKTIQVSLYGKTYEYAIIKDNGGYYYSIIYHPVNYDINGDIDKNHPINENFWSAECIKARNTSSVEVNLTLNIAGPFYPILDDEAGGSIVDPNLFCKEINIKTGTYGAYASLYVDHPNITFSGKDYKQISEKILERKGINEESSGVQIDSIDLSDPAKANDMGLSLTKNCDSNNKNCIFYLTYNPKYNPIEDYSGMIIVKYNTKWINYINSFYIPYKIIANNSSNAPVTGEIIKGLPTNLHGKSMAIFQFNNKSSKPATNVKLTVESADIIKNTCKTTLAPNTSCQVSVNFSPQHENANSISVIFSYDEGGDIILSSLTNVTFDYEYHQGYILNNNTYQFDCQKYQDEYNTITIVCNGTYPSANKYSWDCSDDFNEVLSGKDYAQFFNINNDQTIQFKNIQDAANLLGYDVCKNYNFIL